MGLVIFSAIFSVAGFLWILAIRSYIREDRARRKARRGANRRC